MTAMDLQPPKETRHASIRSRTGKGPGQARADLGTRVILGYAREDEGFYREVCLMLASGCRPGHAQAMAPRHHGPATDTEEHRQARRGAARYRAAEADPNGVERKAPRSVKSR